MIVLTNTKKVINPWFLLITIGLGVLLNPLNSSMIAVALTQMQKDFALTFTDASWLISIFYLASATGQPVMGKLSDMFGAKRLFMVGLILVVISTALAPFSPNYGFLLACRALQAIGSSTLFPSGMSIIRDAITSKQAQALAVISIFSSTSAAFGPTIGGLLVAQWSWPAIFLINVPIIAVSFTMAIFILPKAPKVNFELKRIDFVGIILFTSTILGLILFLLSITDSIRWWALAMFVIAGVLFYLYEVRRKEPFLDILAIQRNKNVTLVYLIFLMINAVYYNFFLGFPTLLQQVQGYTEEVAGFIMLALAGFSVLATPIAGRLIDRKGSKSAMIFGAVFLSLGTGLLLTYNESSYLWWFIIILAILGSSSGFSNLASQTALYEHVAEEDTGSASGLFQTSRYLGAILSGSFLGIAFTGDLDYSNFHNVALVSFIATLLIVVIAFRIPKKEG